MQLRVARIGCESTLVVQSVRAFRRAAKQVGRELIERDDGRERAVRDNAPFVEFATRGALVRRQKSIANRRVERSILAEPLGTKAAPFETEPEVKNWPKP